MIQFISPKIQKVFYIAYITFSLDWPPVEGKPCRAGDLKEKVCGSYLYSIAT